MIISLFFAGLLVGSFLGMLTYRLPRGIPFFLGRSRCLNCKSTISWYDNIPIFSFLILRGRCRNCAKRISLRYPVIEVLTAVIFVLVGPNIINLILSSILIAIAVIDLENQVIPDELVFLGLVIFLFGFHPDFYSDLLAGFLSSLFLLFLNFITIGKGMGLGDVKLSILIGVIVGMKLFLVWMFFSFVAGAIVGIILIITKNANLKQKIAFGPFLIIGLVLVNLLGQTFLGYL